ncbi:Integrin, alpha [Parelaphostrongylus tenuis]|uniref:Integrin, alpha n=1 Tax=Parelaphostrongylus tenuis TaxID=148309 RepID=A0AAD5LVV8_PARTN|nr:Integrin, alpha [Parelaphostrongylus tenuis]
MKWTGGVYARRTEGGIFGTTTEKYTMAQEEGGVRTVLAAHDYLGYSVDVGRFGFWYEKGERATIVSGATRFGQHGAVIFLPFTKMGSAFGYAVEVVDLNNDGFDDLIVVPPLNTVPTQMDISAESFMFISHKEYNETRVSHRSLGNVDGDKNGFNDFAVGAPFANDGEGAVYVYLGQKSIEDFKTTPAQVIMGSDLTKSASSYKILLVFPCPGGSDLDGNGYPDLVIGAVTENFVTILRSRPVISVSASHTTKSNFPLDLEIFVEWDASRGGDLFDFNYNVFTCNLEVIPLKQGVERRAKHRWIGFNEP